MNIQEIEERDFDPNSLRAESLRLEAESESLMARMEWEEERRRWAGIKVECRAPEIEPRVFDRHGEVKTIWF